MSRDRNLVVFPYTNTTVGGSYVSSSILAAQLQRESGWCVRIALPVAGQNHRVFAEQGLRIDFYGGGGVARGGVGRGRAGKFAAFVVGNAAVAVRARMYLKALRPDIIHVHDDGSLPGWAVAARSLRIPIVFHVRGENRKFYDGAIARHVDHVIFLSEYNRRRFAGRQLSGTSSLIPNVVDTDRFLRDPERKFRREIAGDSDRPIVGYIGNLKDRKRPDWFVDAAIRLVREGVDAQFVLIGDDPSGGTYRRTLQQSIDASGFADRIQPLGYRSDIATILGSLDLLCLCSTRHGEAFPRVIIEAMAAGVAVLSTAVAGVPDQVVDGETGVLVDPDEPTEFVTAMRRLISSPEIRRAMGDNGRLRAESVFSLRNGCSEVVRVYDRLKRT